MTKKDHKKWEEAEKLGGAASLKLRATHRKDKIVFQVTISNALLF